MLKHREYEKLYFQKNKVKLCKKLLSEYCFNGIKNVKEVKGLEIEKMYKQYPFEKIALVYFKKLCIKYQIRNYTYRYHECFEACQLAYLYAMARCCIIVCSEDEEHVRAYVFFCMKIYFIAALIVSNEDYYLCKENHMRRIDCNDYRV